MKAKKVKISLQSLESINDEWAKALKGRLKKKPKDDEIIITGFETLAKIFSKTRMEILQTIIRRSPKSIYELAKIVDRDFKNVYSDIQFLSDIGLIELKKSDVGRSGLQPVAKYSGIELDLVA